MLLYEWIYRMQSHASVVSIRKQQWENEFSHCCLLILTTIGNAISINYPLNSRNKTSRISDANVGKLHTNTASKKLMFLCLKIKNRK